jgi:S-DNA-T family DNA segregation ATPase FtsK/SpoIIIE
MPAKSKKSEKRITIKSSETRITLGVLLFVLGLGAVLSAFVVDSQILSFYSNSMGYGAITFGIALIYIALRFITLSNRFKSVKFISGMIVMTLVISTLLAYRFTQEELALMSVYAKAGGTLGYTLHSTFLQPTFGRVLELIIVIFVAVIGLTLVTTLTLEQIIGVFIKGFSAIFGRVQEKTIETADGLIINLADDDSAHAASGKDSKNSSQKGSTHAAEFLDNSQGVMTGMLAKTQPQTTDSKSSGTKQSSAFIDNSGNIIISDKDKATNKDATTEGETNLFEPMYPNWKYPSSTLFKEPVYKPQNPELHKKNAEIIEKTLRSFGIESRVTNIAVGPTVVQYALSITVGTKVAKVKNLANDLALSLAANSSAVRIEAPIPGTTLIGIEIPNPTPNFVYVRELLSDLERDNAKFELPVVLGKSVTGQRIIKDLTDMPHLLVAGATGTGKSVGINSILAGLLATKSPDELRLILVDPKMVEMAPFNGIPHLLIPVITDMELVINALQWAVEEMMRRYRIMKQLSVRKIKEYNQKMGYNAMPYIVIIIDEMADLMLTTGVDVESKIVRLTQMSRAVGIHLILATQRPSVNVITGLIKANVPSRMSFAVATAIDSRVIIDQSGAESLIGKGDMLFKSPEYPRPIRIQDAWTDTKDIENVVTFVKDQTEEVHYFEDITKPKKEVNAEEVAGEGGDFSDDSLFEDALAIVINTQKASASFLQRKFRIGYNRAARLMDELEEAGAIGPADGSNARKVLVSSVEQVLGNKTDNANDIEDLIE